MYNCTVLGSTLSKSKKIARSALVAACIVRAYNLPCPALARPSLAAPEAASQSQHEPPIEHAHIRWLHLHVDSVALCMRVCLPGMHGAPPACSTLRCSPRIRGANIFSRVTVNAQHARMRICIPRNARPNLCTVAIAAQASRHARRLTRNPSQRLSKCLGRRLQAPR